MFSHLAHVQSFFTLSIIILGLALDFDTIGPFEHDLLFSDTGSAASLDQKAPSMFNLAQLSSSSGFLPFDSSSDIFLEEDKDSKDINVQSPTSGNDNDMVLPSLSSESAHADEKFYRDDETLGPLVAAVDDTTFSPSDENARAGSGEIADMSGTDEQLLRNPLDDLTRYRDEGKINPYCFLYTQTYNPVGVCASNRKGNQVEIPRSLRGFSSPTPFVDYKFWDVNHATYGTLIRSHCKLSGSFIYFISILN